MSTQSTHLFPFQVIVDILRDQLVLSRLSLMETELSFEGVLLRLDRCETVSEILKAGGARFPTRHEAAVVIMMGIIVIRRS